MVEFKVSTSMDDWIDTATGNRISRKANIIAPQRISISGNCTISERCVLNGEVNTNSDDPSIVLGKYCFLAENSHVEPAMIKRGSHGVFSDVVIGNYSYFGLSTVIRLAQVGNRVWVGADCILGELSIINDCCVVNDGAHIPPRAVIPPYSEVRGKGSDLTVVELNGGYRKVLEADARMRHLLGQ